MANFKTHFFGGVVIGAVGILVCVISAFETDITWLAILLGAVVCGSFLPDMDLDNGIPFQIIFGLLGIGASGVVFYDHYNNGHRDWFVLAILTIMAFVVIRFIIGEIFMRFTDHRGIWHSVPAAVLTGLCIHRGIIAFFPSVDAGIGLLAGIAVFVGYIGHLMLDEVYASVNLSGGSFLPKRSLGSAFKLYARSKIATTIVYGSIVYMLFF